MTTKIKVLDEPYCYRTSQEEDSNTPYSCRADTNTEHRITGIQLIENEDNFYDFEIPFGVELGKTYFLVYVTYSTGDSFGSDDGNIEYIDMFRNEKKALALREKIENQNEQYREFNRYSPPRGKNAKVKAPPDKIIYKNDAGTEISFYPGAWQGYFERLQSVTVEAVDLVRIISFGEE